MPDDTLRVRTVAPPFGAACGMPPPNRVFKNKHQAVSQGVRRFGKRSIFSDM